MFKAFQRNEYWPVPYTEPPLILGNLHERHYESIHPIYPNLELQVPLTLSGHIPSKDTPPTSSKDHPVSPVREGVAKDPSKSYEVEAQQVGAEGGNEKKLEQEEQLQEVDEEMVLASGEDDMEMDQ